MHHYIVNSGLTDVMMRQLDSFKSLYLYIIGAWGKADINCFIMITGYFMCKSHITMRKFLRLFLMIIFYNIVITSIFILTSYEPLGLRHMLKEINPIASIDTGFCSCYLMFFLLIPFMNTFLRFTNQQQHLSLICILLFIYTILGMLPFIHVTMNYISWFCVLYFIASYIRLYPSYFKKSTAFWGWTTLAIILASILSILAVAFYHKYTGRGADRIYFFVVDSNKVFPVLLGITSFLFFKQVQIPQSKFINTVAACTFGVLLIHANSDTMRQWLWKTMCDNVGLYDSNWIYLHAILVPIAVFSICIVIEYIRIKIIEQPILNFCMPLARKFENHIKKFENNIIA